MNKIRSTIAFFGFLAVLFFFCTGLSASDRIVYLGYYRLSSSDGTDVWGYVDPVSGKEYALMGSRYTGLKILDVSDPENPTLVAQVTETPGFDIKVWKSYAYSVTGLGAGLGRIIDLSDVTQPRIAGSFQSAHNIFIDNRGYMYLETPGIRIYDLNPDPKVPVEVWSGGSEGHDAAVVGNRLYDFHGKSGTYIYDVTDPREPQLLGRIWDLNIFYHHSGWPSEDGNYLFITDESSHSPYADFTVWDIRDPENPIKVGQYADNSATVHNLYVKGTYAFTSYYYSGFRVFDIAEPSNPLLVAEYDTSPLENEAWGGAFGVYTFAPSGNIYVSDESGLFIFNFISSTDTAVENPADDLPLEFRLEQNYPNPFNGSTKITYHVPRESNVHIQVFNILGQPVRELISSTLPAGTHTALWDGKNEAGIDTGSGQFILRLQAGDFEDNRKIVHIR